LAADRKVVAGEESRYECKICPVLPSNESPIFAVSGLTGIRDDFHRLALTQIGRGRPINLYEVRLVVEDILDQLAARYEERLPRGYQHIDGLLVGLKELDSGPAMIYHIIGGFGEEVSSYKIIGRGREYAVSLANYLLDENLSADRMIELVIFIITWVGKIAESVGCEEDKGPDVFFLKDEEAAIKTINEKKILKVKKATDKLDIDKLRDAFPKNLVSKDDYVEVDEVFVKKYE